jgi:DNA modification methylase
VTYYTDPLVTLLHGDCLEVLPTLDADSVDAVVTDPPYGLEFMGKEWDAFKGSGVFAGGGRAGNKEGGNWNSPRYIAGHPFQAWCEQWGREALRVTKPGGYLLAFGGTRTHHRLVCALEDAGWIIRDELDWIYASGFPKGKANLKPAHEPIVLARKPGPLRPLGIDECRIPADPADRAGWADSVGSGPKFTGRVYGASDTQGEPMERDPAGRWPSNVLLSDPELFDEPNPYVVGSGATTTVPGTYQSKPRTEWQASSYPGSPPGDLVEGYGDSGGYSRFFKVPHQETKHEVGTTGRDRLDSRPVAASDMSEPEVPSAEVDVSLPPDAPQGDSLGAYPSHFIIPKADRAERERGLTGVSDQELAFDDFNRNVGNTVAQRRANVHPTVKPIDLMRHLVRLVTPPGGVVLDPFLGSGTTCLAASEEGFRSIGIERELEYLEIAKGRLMATPMGLGLDVPVVQPPKKMSPGHEPAYRSPHAVDGWGFSGGTPPEEEPAA